MQISSYDLVRVGDWIEVPQYGADGDVIDIALHTIKVQNWDKTISVVPTNKMMETSYKNWRGMSDSGGRRIKRPIHLDLTTIRFLDDATLEGYQHIELVHDYVEEKLAEMRQWKRVATISSMAQRNAESARQNLALMMSSNSHLRSSASS